MNTQTNPDRKLAEALKSLALDPVEETPAAAARRRAPLAAVTLAVLLGAAGLGYWQWPSIRAALPSTDSGGPARAAAAPVGTPGAPPVQDAASATTPAPAAGTDNATATAPVGQEITGSGYVVAPQHTTVSSQYAGDIVAIPAHVGEQVTRGQALVRLSDPDADFALQKAVIAERSATLELAARQIALKEARAISDRASRLSARGALSQQQADSDLTALQSAQNAVAQARASLAAAALARQEAQSHLDRLVIRAPISGIVTKLPARVGDSVLARADSGGRGEALATITDTRDLVIDADIAESAIAGLHPGLTGRAVLDSFPDQPFTVRITRIAPVVSAEKGTVSLRLALGTAPKGIRPNMAASIRLVAPPPARRN